MNKLDEIIDRIEKEELPEGYTILDKRECKLVALEFAKHILEEAADNAESFISEYSHNGEQYCETEVDKQSITDTLNKYL